MWPNSATAPAWSPTDAPSRGERVRAAEGAENFPVALRVLPAQLRCRLRAVYDVVRVIDDLGDEPGPVAGSGTTAPGRTPGERIDRLAEFRDDLVDIWAGGTPRAPVLRALAPIVAAADLSREPFDRLLAANLIDQRVERYATWDDLLAYCALSAEPIGHIVLELFAVRADPRSKADCDAVCTALQLLEHWGDVAQDRRRGRVYLPSEDLAAFGVADADLDRTATSPALRRLVLHETDRALALLDRGDRAVGALHGWARLAVAGYVAGGRAAADGLRRAGGDVLRDDGRAATRRRTDVARHLVRSLVSVTVRSPR